MAFVWSSVNCSVKLRITHRPDRLRQGGRASVVKIRRRDRDVPQAWDANDLGLGRGKRMKYPVPLVHVAADIDALDGKRRSQAT